MRNIFKCNKSSVTVLLLPKKSYEICFLIFSQTSQGINDGSTTAWHSEYVNCRLWNNTPYSGKTWEKLFLLIASFFWLSYMLFEVATCFKKMSSNPALWNFWWSEVFEITLKFWSCDFCWMMGKLIWLFTLF